MEGQKKTVQQKNKKLAYFGGRDDGNNVIQSSEICSNDSVWCNANWYRGVACINGSLLNVCASIANVQVTSSLDSSHSIKTLSPRTSRLCTLSRACRAEEMCHDAPPSIQWMIHALQVEKGYEQHSSRGQLARHSQQQRKDLIHLLTRRFSLHAALISLWDSLDTLQRTPCKQPRFPSCCRFFFIQLTSMLCK